MTDTPEKSCGACAKRHAHRETLQCRALPPRQDLGQYAIFPTVRATDYCHLFLSEDDAGEMLPSVAAAPRARRARSTPDAAEALSLPLEPGA